ncbi:unnamed protein product [Gordionus sp. m RMFG-2023]
MVHGFITHENVKPLTPMILEFLLKWAQNRCIIHCKPVSPESIINTLNENGFKIMTYIDDLNYLDFREIILKRKVLDNNSLIELFSDKMRRFSIEWFRPISINLEISLHCHKFIVNSSVFNTFPTHLNVCQQVYVVRFGYNFDYNGRMCFMVKDGDQICYQLDLGVSYESATVTKNPNIHSLYHFGLPLIPLYHSYNCSIDFQDGDSISEITWNGKALKVISNTPDPILKELFYV